MVQATDSTGKTGMKMVTVEVTNVDEPGMVNLSALQPQSGTVVLTATILPTLTTSVPSGLKWQWAKSRPWMAPMPTLTRPQRTSTRRR